ncbi:MAG: DASS family sodium-coupled anion symporter [Bryobacterales bacterium]|nr:DASS family sodium-coupled anion symporter [Bryobacterales bacterium]
MSQPTVERRLASGAGLVLIYLFIQYAIPRPESVQPEGWRLLGIFVATIAGLILQPIPGGALVLMAVTLASLAGGLTIQEALGGYGDPTVWLVMAAFFISTAMIKTGLARRIALLFVRLVGRTSLGVTYALSATDMVLASIIPSNAARSGGVVLPIARSIAELYDSRPGPTASRLGTFLTCAVYQNICVTAAMFLTGQASNPLAAKIAADTLGYPLDWLKWAAAGIVPGLASLIAGPLLVRRLEPPEIRRTPEAAAFAARELKAMGPIDWAQGTVLSIFVSVCGLWMTTPLHGLDIALTALLGSCALLAVGILTWEDVVSEKAAWSIFIWYGGLVRLGKALNDAGVTQEFAKGVGGLLPGSGWVLLFALALAIYFYSHYGFASITAHILAMFAPFAAVLIAKGAPVGLVVLAFACFTNLAAGLTHYGTTPSPMFFATNYASFRSFWRVGFAVSLLNIAIWTTLGFAWWKLIGVW